jgi:Ca-activated chloride channel family protein
MLIKFTFALILTLTIVISASSDVRVDVSPLYKVLNINKPEVLVPILFKITTPEKQNATRVPLDLVLVLDRSGSMQGDKIEKSKLAITQIIDHMGNNDRLHLIEYGSSVNTVFTHGTIEDKENLLVKVRGIRALDGTNLYNGLVAAKDLIQDLHQRSALENIKRLRRVFLFSDGEANEGNVNPRDIESLSQHTLDRYDTQVSSFGVGAYFNEPLMRGIAQHGGGEYFFIGNAEDISHVVGIATKGSMSIIGRKAILRLFPNENVKVTKVYGSKSTENGLTSTQIGDLRSDDTRRMMVDLIIRTAGFKHGEMKTLLAYAVEYENVETGKLEIVAGEMTMECTENEIAATEQHHKVRAYYKIQAITEKEAVVDKYLQEGNIQYAMQEKAQIVHSLGEVAEEEEEEEEEGEDDGTSEMVAVIRDRSKKSYNMMADSVKAAPNAPSAEMLQKTNSYYAKMVYSPQKKEL